MKNIIQQEEESSDEEEEEEDVDDNLLFSNQDFISKSSNSYKQRQVQPEINDLLRELLDEKPI